HRYGLGIAVITGSLHRLATDGRIIEGEYLPSLVAPQWCDSEVLRLLKRRSLAKLRHEAEPVPGQVLAAFLPAWQDAVHATNIRTDASLGRAGAGPRQPRRRSRVAGPDAVYSVVEQLAGAAIPAAALESLILPARVPGYEPAMLDELTAAGDVIWAGAGALPGGDGWLVLAPAGSAPLLLPPPGERTMTPVHQAVLWVVSGGGALFFRALADRVVDQLTAEKPGPAAREGADRRDAARRIRVLNRLNDQAIAAAIWDLAWA